MAHPTKHLPHGGGGPVLSELKTFLRAPRRTATFAYGFVFTFVALTVFLLFYPAPSSSSPWLSNIFTSTSAADPYRSQFSSSSSSPPQPIAPNFFPPPPPPPSPNSAPRPQNATGSTPLTVKDHDKVPDLAPVLTTNETSDSKNSTQISGSGSKPQAAYETLANQTRNSPGPSCQGPPAKNDAVKKAVNSVPADKGIASNNTGWLLKKQSNINKTATAPVPVTGASHGNGNDPMESLKKCDFFDGQWVKDDAYPLYETGSCSLIDEQFNCVLNGRPDTDYHKLRWKPRGCDLPRCNLYIRCFFIVILFPLLFIDSSYIGSSWSKMLRSWWFRSSFG